MLELNNISLPTDYGIVLTRLSLVALDGRITCISGRAKRTVLRAMMGFVDVLEGVISIDGEPLTKKSATALRQLMNYMPRRLEPAGTCPVYEPPTADDVARLKANRLGRKKQIVLVDEPPSEMLQRLQQMAAEGLTVIVSTDDEGLLHSAHEVVRLQN